MGFSPALCTMEQGQNSDSLCNGRMAKLAFTKVFKSQILLIGKRKEEYHSATNSKMNNVVVVVFWFYWTLQEKAGYIAYGTHCV